MLNALLKVSKSSAICQGLHIAEKLPFSFIEYRYLDSFLLVCKRMTTGEPLDFEWLITI